MSSYQFVGLIMVVIGIILIVFCRRITNLIRSYWHFIGIDLSEWKGIAGLSIVGIAFIYSGIQWIFG